MMIKVLHFIADINLYDLIYPNLFIHNLKSIQKVHHGF